ncbi:hypothetical protein cyc_01877 [Cyclospora cayetanensis]|uniref:Uncharacterized protein n=1 Tax=Cyclospora cayetanensis TaxID=88456 RepID=A0A1D3D3R6_9EIME|nr:hypothetical protein cyc_01877 [Cyclospora cayetanensis]
MPDEWTGDCRRAEVNDGSTGLLQRHAELHSSVLGRRCKYSESWQRYCLCRGSANAAAVCRVSCLHLQRQLPQRRSLLLRLPHRDSSRKLIFCRYCQRETI